MSQKYRIVVDHGICQGHGVCAAEAPELFRLADVPGYSYQQSLVLVDELPEELRAKAELAEELCPNSAIRIVPIGD